MHESNQGFSLRILLGVLKTKLLGNLHRDLALAACHDCHLDSVLVEVPIHSPEKSVLNRPDRDLVLSNKIKH